MSCKIYYDFSRSLPNRRQNGNGKKAPKTRYKVEQCKTCGSKIVYVNRSRHRRSRKHKDAEYLWHDMLEAI